jgi:hypothetical protein
MAKIKLRQAVVFDGKTYPAGHVFNTNELPISAECLIQREWGDEVSEDTESSVDPVPEAPVEPEPQVDKQADQPAEESPPAVEPPAPKIVSPAPVVEPPKKPRKK